MLELYTKKKSSKKIKNIFRLKFSTLNICKSPTLNILRLFLLFVCHFAFQKQCLHQKKQKKKLLTYFWICCFKILEFASDFLCTGLWREWDVTVKFCFNRFNMSAHKLRHWCWTRGATGSVPISTPMIRIGQDIENNIGFELQRKR